jgi:hypothetical protein
MNPQPPTFAHFNSSDRPTATIRSASDFARVHVARRPAPRALIACALACLLSVGASASGVARKAAPRARGAKPHAAKAAGTTAKGDDKAAAAQPSPTPQTAAQPTPSPLALEDPEFYAYPTDDGLKRYALVVKRKDGDGSFFGTDPSLVSLSLTPAGAADITIRRVTPTRIEADFRAPDNYKIKDVGVTVYDATNRQLVVASSDVKKSQPPPGPNQEPEITSTDVIFLQRAYGIGRLKIEGNNFGNYKAPPMSAEDYLLCFEPLARQALVNALKEGEHPQPEKQQQLEDQRCKNLKTTVEQWNAWRAEVEPRVKVALVPRNTDLRIEQTKILYIDDKLIDVYFEFNRYYHNSEPLRLASATVTVKRDAKQPPGAKPPAAGGQAQTAAARGADGASVINAAMNPGTGKEEVRPALPANLETFIATKEVGTKQDANLEYRYTVLDSNSAGTLFGKGVADNFYVIQLSVTNKGDKKVAVPLASIQAEIEWAYGLPDSSDQTQGGGKPGQRPRGGKPDVKRDGAQQSKSLTAPAFADTTESKTGGTEISSSASPVPDYYEEGPATLAPLPLPAVTAFFDGDEKVNGRKAKLFNVFDGAAIVGTSLIPFLGQGFQKAEGAFTGGFVPGLRRGLGDLSGQQLQNLAALSWQSVEVVAARGGSVEKFVFIQRRDQIFSTGFNERLLKQIKNIEGMEVVGYEVIEEGEAKRATPAGEQ